MIAPGRILLADDDEVFLQATSTFLQRVGMDCDTVRDAASAERLLRTNTYDVLLCDVRMPGNEQLEFVSRVSEICEIYVILVTGNPTMESAIQSYQFSVSAYLVKPVDTDELIRAVRTGIERFRLNREVADASRRLDQWRSELKGIQTALKQRGDPATSAALGAFFQLAFTNIVGALSDLQRLTDSLWREQGEPYACKILNCPKGSSLTNAVKETIQVLEKTKGAFKSKELGELRKKLEALISTEP